MTGPSSEKKLQLIFLTPFVDYGFFRPMRKGVQDAAKALNVHATFTGTRDGNVTVLARRVCQAVKEGYDGIALNIVDSEAFDEAVAYATQQSVPVIAFNVDDNGKPNARLAAVGQNMPQAGRTFGKAVDPLIPSGSHVLLTMHDPNISALEDRAAGMREVLRPKDITWHDLITGTEPNCAMERIRQTLLVNSSIRIVLGTGSADTEAAGQAIERHFAGQGYLCAGFDLSPEILRLIKAHVIRLSVDEQPYAQGFYSVVALTLLCRYGIAPANIDTGATIIDADHADEIIELNQKHYR